MNFTPAQWVGWTATAITVSSYFCRDPRLLRLVQATGALFWIAYGVLIASGPVIGTNVLVTLAAIWTTFRRPAGPTTA